MNEIELDLKCVKHVIWYHDTLSHESDGYDVVRSPKILKKIISQEKKL